MKILHGTLVAAGALVLAALAGAPAQAAGVCNCCNGQVEELCKAACEAANSGGGGALPAFRLVW